MNTICLIAFSVAVVWSVGCTVDDFDDEGCVGGSCARDVHDVQTGADGLDAGPVCEGCIEGAEERCVEGTESEACGADGEACRVCGEGKVCNEEGACVESSCGPENCGGCCRDGRCRLGTKDFACGSGGAACVNCGDGQQCTPDGNCVTCNGCWDSEGYCREGTSSEACGTGGGTCAACDDGTTCQDGECVEKEEEPCSETCIGCCEDGECKQGGSVKACGRGGASCETCSDGFSCESGACALSPGSQWTVVGLEATIIQSSVDIDVSSAPDPRLEVRVGDASGETSSLSDTYVPTWGEETVSATASDIKSDLTYTLWDKDTVSGDDKIVSDCSPSISDEDFTKDEIRHTCIGGADADARATVRFRLVP